MILSSRPADPGSDHDVGVLLNAELPLCHVDDQVRDIILWKHGGIDHQILIVLVIGIVARILLVVVVPCLIHGQDHVLGLVGGHAVLVHQHVEPVGIGGIDIDVQVVL